MTYTIERNNQYGSLEVYFDSKPSDAVRDALKLLRFRWHGVKKCWYGFAEEINLRNAILEACDGIDTVVTDGYLGATAVYGAKSREYLHGSDLSAAIRADLKNNGIKGVTVSCKTYAGGQSITATIKTTSADFVPFEDFLQSFRCTDHTWITTAENPAGIHVDSFLAMDNEQQAIMHRAAAEYEYHNALTTSRCLNNHYLDRYTEYTDAFCKKLFAVDKIIRAYRYDDSNGMVDYFDTNFYYDIRVRPC